MRIAIINKDMPFLVDSIGAALAARGLAIDVLVHPILPVRRKDGALSELPEGEGTGEKKESWVYLETPRVEAKERRALETELRNSHARCPRRRGRLAADAAASWRTMRIACPMPKARRCCAGSPAGC